MPRLYGWTAVLFMVGCGSPSSEASRLEVEARDFTATKYLTPQQRQTIRKDNLLHFIGEAEYRFQVPAAGWYEFWVEAAEWPTDVYLDGEFLIHTVFTSGVWEPRDRLQKVMNLHLTAGSHRLRFVRTWHPGLPYLHRFVLVGAGDVSGMARWRLEKDRLCFRKDETVRVTLRAGRRGRTYTLLAKVIDLQTGRTATRLPQRVPAGEGVFTRPVVLPTDREGVFSLRLTDANGRPCARRVDYLVVDTRTPPAAPTRFQRTLVQTIDCAARKPDYASSPTRVVRAAFGAYRESGARGQAEQGLDADWFAYTLSLPSVQDPYLVEIDYPDDDERTFTYAVIEKDLPGGRALTHGVASGGIYPLTQQMQTTEILFYPRQRDPRLLFRNWWTHQRAAVARIRVYRIDGGTNGRSDFPALFPPTHTPPRLFGRFQEEPLRFVQWGARPEGNRWRNLWEAAERIGRFSRFVGANLWQPTVAIYGAKMWPSKHLPSLDPDADLWGTVGPPTRNEPVAKDTLRLLLLVAEKYRMKFIAELFMPAGRDVARAYFEERVGGDGDTAWEKTPTSKPWLLVDGKGGSPGTPLYNPLHPAVQEWVADIVRELAQRYKDSPAFAGVAVRFMGWQFHSWQGFPSIHWGYGDWTIAQFQQETGLKVPGDAGDPGRFQVRFGWLLAHAYDEWVQWRCRKLYAYHSRLAKILTTARPDLKLYLELYGPNFGNDASQQERDGKGWSGLLRETGIDPDLYKRNAALILRVVRVYPPGRRGIQTKDPVVRAARVEAAKDAGAVDAAAQPRGTGTVSAVHLDANSFESNMVKVPWLGLGDKLGGGQREIHGAGLVFPAGRHFLARFADTMADGNVVSLVDGSHGYIMWPPKYLREFTAEYGLLPDIGMSRLEGTGDPVALWQGEAAGRRSFYLVNRAPFPVHVDVAFTAAGVVRRVRTGKTTRVGEGRPLRVALQSYELGVFACSLQVRPVAARATVPQTVRTGLQEQLGFADTLLSLKRPHEEVLPFSLVDLERARKKLSQARSAFAAGRYCTAQRLLRHHYLVKLYAALSVYPPNLFFRKAPPRPQGALTPAALLKRTIPSDRPIVRVIPADRVEPTMAGVNALEWSDRRVTFSLQTPVANRYRLSYAYLTGHGHSRPVVSIASPSGGPHSRIRSPLPDPEAQCAEENDRWGRLPVRRSLALPAGRVRVQVTPREGAVGLLYLALSPVYRDLVACDWAVLGPFPGERRFGAVGEGMNHEYAVERIREYDGVYIGDKGKRLRWRRPQSRAPYLDLYTVTGAYADKVSYAATIVDSPQSRRATVRFGVDYWARLWVNGKQVFEMTEGHGPPRRHQFTIQVNLRKGANELFLKIHAGSRGNGFWLSVSDPGDLIVRPPVTGDA